MIYLIYGTDGVKARVKWHGVVASLRAKRPECEYFTLGEEASVSKLAELLLSQGLFSAKYIVGTDNMLANPELVDYLEENLNELASSEHAFVMLEAEVGAKLLAKLEKLAFKTEKFDLREGSKEKFNIFLLTDALAERNRQKLWVNYQKALRSGLAEEEIFWKLVWQIKTLLSVKVSKNPEKLGMKPYPLQKAQANAKKFETGELTAKLSELTDMYHQVRRGQVELETELEKFALGI